MVENHIVRKLEEVLKDIVIYEKRGFDASSLKIFLKNFKQYLIDTGQNSTHLFDYNELDFDKKLEIIQAFLEDEKAFPTIKDIIVFANEELGLEFKDQKVSRETTISRIISRIKLTPDLKDRLKKAVMSIRNDYVHPNSLNIRQRIQKHSFDAATFLRWAEIIKNL